MASLEKRIFDLENRARAGEHKLRPVSARIQAMLDEMLGIESKRPEYAMEPSELTGSEPLPASVQAKIDEILGRE